MTECIFCLKPILEQEKSVILTQKGVDGILKACDEREDNLSVIVGQSVHTLCRARYINPKTVLLQKKRRNENKDEDGEHSLRSDSSFSYKDNCILCGCPDIYDGKKQDYKLIPVRTMDFGDKLLQACESFPGAWADDVRGRVLFANDLPAADAVYHSACNINFRTGRSIPKKFDVGETYVPWKRKKLSRSGRPKDIERHEAFLMTMEYFQNNDDETVSVQDLMEKMRELLCDTGVEPYGLTHMKNEIQQHFNEKVVITANQGKENIVTLHTTASQIIDKFHQESTKDEDQEKKLIIESAAKLIKQDIKEVKQVKDIYPDLEDLSTETCLQFIPQSLLQFLQSLLSGKKADNKIASIGQALMQADNGDNVSKYLLFAHALLGCDTTSRVFGIGKQKAINRLKEDENFRKVAATFMSCSSSANEIEKSGNSALVAMYNGRQNDNLDDLRYQQFCEKTARNTIAVDPSSLPPTSSAAKFHSLRVYQQVQVWLGNEINVPPEQWGWCVIEGRLAPVMTDKPPAPSLFLEMIVCHCKTGCATLRCTCRKSGLDCTIACGECHGSCINSSLIEDSDADDTDTLV